MTEESQKRACWACIYTLLIYCFAVAFALEFLPTRIPLSSTAKTWIMLGFVVSVTGWLITRGGNHFHLLSGFGGYVTSWVVMMAGLAYASNIGGSPTSLAYLLLFLSAFFLILRMMISASPDGPQTETESRQLTTVAVIGLISCALLDMWLVHALRHRLLVLFIIAGSSFILTIVSFWNPSRKKDPTLPFDRFVLRNTSEGHIIIKPGERYKKKDEDTLVYIKPQRKLFQTPEGPRIVRWQPDADNLETYVEFYRPLRDTCHETFIAGLEEFFVLNSRPTIPFLQDRFADHLGVQILTIDLPPEPVKPKEPTRDTRTPAQKAIALMRAKANSARELTAFWQSLPNDPDFAEVMKDPKAKTLLRGQFDQLMTDITEGRLP